MNRSARAGFWRLLLNVLAGLMLTAPALPLFAVGTAIIVYVNPSPVALDREPAGDAPKVPAPAPKVSGPAALARGLAVGLVGWLVLGLVAASLGSVDRANRGVYHALNARLSMLDIERQSVERGLDQRSSMGESSGVPSAGSALKEVELHVTDLKRELRGDTN